jgi:hypothetical protein
MDLPLAVGGRTALEELGYAHYLSAQMREVHAAGFQFTDRRWMVATSGSSGSSFTSRISLPGPRRSGR